MRRQSNGLTAACGAVAATTMVALASIGGWLTLEAAPSPADRLAAVQALGHAAALADAMSARLPAAADGSLRRVGSGDPAQSEPDAMRGQLEALPAEVIKQRYLACSDEATERRMSGGQAALCSTIYDVLLKRHFGGDFGALYAWSRRQPAARSGAPGERVAGEVAGEVAGASRERAAAGGRWI